MVKRWSWSCSLRLRGGGGGGLWHSPVGWRRRQLKGWWIDVRRSRSILFMIIMSRPRALIGIVLMPLNGSGEFVVVVIWILLLLLLLFLLLYQSRPTMIIRGIQLYPINSIIGIGILRWLLWNAGTWSSSTSTNNGNPLRSIPLQSVCCGWRWRRLLLLLLLWWSWSRRLILWIHRSNWYLNCFLEEWFTWVNEWS